MRDLQHVYEQILGVSLDRRNFRKKIFSTGLLKDEEEMEQKVNHRPGKLFSFSSETYEQIKKKSSVSFRF
jgi:8-oxo-dGTP diphosphatase